MTIRAAKIQSFTALEVWQEGHKLVLLIYRLTDHFPRAEVFGLVSQMRRCVVSITSNIAEGFRRRSNLEKIRFYDIAHGSLTELQNQLLVSRDVACLTSEEFIQASEQTVVVGKLLGGSIRYLKK